MEGEVGAGVMEDAGGVGGHEGAGGLGVGVVWRSSD